MKSSTFFVFSHWKFLKFQRRWQHKNSCALQIHAPEILLESCLVLRHHNRQDYSQIQTRKETSNLSKSEFPQIEIWNMDPVASFHVAGAMFKNKPVKSKRKDKGPSQSSTTSQESVSSEKSTKSDFSSMSFHLSTFR